MPTMTPDILERLRDPAFLAQFQTAADLADALTAWGDKVIANVSAGDPLSNICLDGAD